LWSGLIISKLASTCFQEPCVHITLQLWI
jgi:hypothetical protein